MQELSTRKLHDVPLRVVGAMRTSDARYLNDASRDARRRQQCCPLQLSGTRYVPRWPLSDQATPCAAPLKESLDGRTSRDHRELVVPDPERTSSRSVCWAAQVTVPLIVQMTAEEVIE